MSSSDPTEINFDDLALTPKTLSYLPHRKGKQVQGKLWQFLPCNFRFFFNGHVMIGPGRPFWIYILFLLIGISSSFVFFDFLPFYTSIADTIPIIFLSFLVLTSFYNLLRVIFTDPGYMIPHWFSDQYSWLTHSTSISEIHDRFGFTSYCSICKIFQFPDTFHCHECHACIDGGDHHCHILGTCVGRRNYRNFYLFTLSTNLALLFSLVMTIMRFIQNWESSGVLYALSQAITFYLIISTLVLPPLGLYVMLLLPIAHARLIYYGLTLSQEDYSFSNLYDLHDLTLGQKVRHFFNNFHKRVIAGPPKSQIPIKVLKLNVKLPAISRTQIAHDLHNHVQSLHLIPKVKLVMRSRFNNPTYFTYRMQIIHQDMENFAKFTIPIKKLQLSKIQSNLDSVAISLKQKEVDDPYDFQSLRNFWRKKISIFPEQFQALSSSPSISSKEKADDIEREKLLQEIV